MKTAEERAVLAVLRGSLRVGSSGASPVESEVDLAAFATHAHMLAKGYRVVALGKDADDWEHGEGEVRRIERSIRSVLTECVTHLPFQ